MGALVAAGCSDLIGADWERYKPGGGEGAASGSGGGAAAGSSGEGAASGSGGEGAAAGSGGEAGGCGLNGDGGSGAGAGGGPISSMAPKVHPSRSRHVQRSRGALLDVERHG
ncbi:hypothetical protein WME73_37245 [Sorangium sp. So ce302]|uniref:hypothetical protein n=1 Tax=Sorangium sp. So ce302 TaxID=3133297 RepID=UPI003F63424B